MYLLYCKSNSSEEIPGTGKPNTISIISIKDEQLEL